MIAVASKVLASTVSSKVRARTSEVRSRSKVTRVGDVISSVKPCTFAASSISISTTEFSFMSKTVSLLKAR